MPKPEQVYTLSDLENWPQTGVSLAVLGHPIAHSLSPLIHNAALKHLASEEESLSQWNYYKFDIEPENLSEALPRFAEKGFLGLNLTVPHKVDAVSMVAVEDSLAASMGAVNTLLKTEAGYVGYNTDGLGLSQALQSAFSPADGSAIAGESVILLGAGGAARGAAVQCLEEGCGSLWIGNRNADRLAELITTLEPWKERVHGFDLSNPNPPAMLPREGILINATALGLKEEDPAPIKLGAFLPDLCVYDMVYNPPETALLREARACGMRAENGLSMLVGQGAQALQIWLKAAFSKNSFEDLEVIRQVMYRVAIQSLDNP